MLNPYTPKQVKPSKSGPKPSKNSIYTPKEVKPSKFGPKEIGKKKKERKAMNKARQNMKKMMMKKGY